MIFLISFIKNVGINLKKSNKFCILFRYRIYLLSFYFISCSFFKFFFSYFYIRNTFIHWKFFANILNIFFSRSGSNCGSIIRSFIDWDRIGYTVRSSSQRTYFCSTGRVGIYPIDCISKTVAAIIVRHCCISRCLGQIHGSGWCVRPIS